jgi:hypothetical protein
MHLTDRCQFLNCSVNVPVFLHGTGRMDLDGGNPFIGTFEVVGPEIETFLGPEMATSAASAIWAPKMALVMNNKNINSYYVPMYMYVK